MAVNDNMDLANLIANLIVDQIEIDYFEFNSIRAEVVEEVKIGIGPEDSFITQDVGLLNDNNQNTGFVLGKYAYLML